MPQTLTGRWDFYLSPDFLVFFYGGIQYSLPIASSQGTESSVRNLTYLTPTGGGGLGFRFGPKWFIRADIGFDGLTLGVALRF